MAARKFFGKVLRESQDDVLMTGRAGHDTTVTITITNQGTGAARVSLALSSGGDISGDWLFYNVLLNANTTKEIRGLAVESGVQVIARTESTNALAVVNAVGYGFESEV